ncbi:MAG TPA: DNA-3-methyladenine glycosylase [Candidatus Eisenbacteria bacterium]|nr:DNA-3-methyladenine glycosylase [Candidatus Eisenbacteria bacterium]
MATRLNAHEPRRQRGRILPLAFFERPTLEVARDLLGCLLCRREDDGTLTAGRIVETEAYIGEDDPACHARAGLTPRTRVLYGPPGRSYVYFTYGMHYLFNAVTESKGRPAAVLVRALRPEAGLERMMARRGTQAVRDLARGPARLCEAMDIDLDCNDVSLRGPILTLREDGWAPDRIASGPRIGIRHGADRPWRFWIEGEAHVSRGPSASPSMRRIRRG